MDVIYIGETENNLSPVIAPNEMTETFSDLDAASTTRTANGLMVRSVVRGGDNNVRSVKFKWNNLTLAKASALLNIVKGTYFYMKYPDVQTGANRTKRFYCGDREVQIKRIDGGEPFIKEISFNTIER